VAELGPGEITGEMSFVDANPPSATVTALENSVVLAIPKAQLLAKLEESPDFAARFYLAIAIFLSYRLRGIEIWLGYLDTKLPTPEEEPEDVGQLDENVLDTVSLAGERFERMLKQLMQE
jgi:CRP-like cAMP-binding protein